MFKFRNNSRDIYYTSELSCPGEAILGNGFPDLVSVDGFEFNWKTIAQKAMLVAARLETYRYKDLFPESVDQKVSDLILFGRVSFKSTNYREYPFIGTPHGDMYYGLNTAYITADPEYAMYPFIVIRRKTRETLTCLAKHLRACAHFLKNDHINFFKEEILEHFNSFEDRDEAEYWMRVVVCEHPEQFNFKLEKEIW